MHAQTHRSEISRAWQILNRACLAQTLYSKVRPPLHMIQGQDISFSPLLSGKFTPSPATIVWIISLYPTRDSGVESFFGSPQNVLKISIYRLLAQPGRWWNFMVLITERPSVWLRNNTGKQFSHRDSLRPVQLIRRPTSSLQDVATKYGTVITMDMLS